MRGHEGSRLLQPARRLASYLTTKPTVTGISKKVRSGRIYVTFTLSKISTITVRATGGGTSIATVYRGKRVFSVKKGSSNAVTITAKDLAGNYRASLEVI